MKATRAQIGIARSFLTGKDISRFDIKRTARIIHKYAEAWAMRRLYVERKFHPVHEGRVLQGVTYSQAISIGPRGGIKKIYDTIY